MTMLGKVAKMQEHESCEYAIAEDCQTYDEMGELFTQLLKYHGGACGFDDDAVEFLHRMMREYLDEII